MIWISVILKNRHCFNLSSKTELAMIVSIIGFMGAGKSHLAGELSQIFNIPALDLDREIERAEGDSISYIFEQHGENWFRSLEKKHLTTILEQYCSAADIPPKTSVIDIRYKEDLLSHIKEINSSQPITLFLSTGGGTLLDKQCQELISQHTFPIFLNTPIEIIIDRLKSENEERPLLRRDPENIVSTVNELYIQRIKGYNEIARIRFSEHLLSVSDILYP